MTDKRAGTAHHEAAHAVIGRVLGIEVPLATIRPDEDSAGHVEHEACWPGLPDETAEDAEDRLEELRQRDEVAEKRAIFALAGPIAHMKFQPTLNGERFANGSDDLLDVAVYLKIVSGFHPLSELLVPGRPLEQDNKETSRLWERLQWDTAELVESYWPSIERVAEALLIHEELNQEQIDALIGERDPSHA
jgi:hypothetical protein